MDGGKQGGGNQQYMETDFLFCSIVIIELIILLLIDWMDSLPPSTYFVSSFNSVFHLVVFGYF